MHKIGHGGTHFTSWATELRTIAFNVTVPAIAYSPCAKKIVVAAGPNVLVITAANFTRESELTDAHGGAAVRGVAFAGSDSVVATVGDDGQARTWHCKAAQITFESAAGESPALCIAFGVAGGQPSLAVGYADGRAHLWRLTGESVALNGHTAPVLGVDFSSEGSSRYVASASADGTARLWSSADGACVAVLRPPTAGVCHQVRFGVVRTRDLVVVATASGAAHAFSLPPLAAAPGSDVAPTAEVTPTLSFGGHTAGVSGVAIGENGEVLATASLDKTVKLWKLRTGEHCRALPGGGSVRAVSFSSAGAANLVLATAKGTVRVFGIRPK